MYINPMMSSCISECRMDSINIMMNELIISSLPIVLIQDIFTLLYNWTYLIKKMIIVPLKFIDFIGLS